MELTALAAEAAIEETHWWYIGRRRLFQAIIERLKMPHSAEILDVGTGTGANLRLLRDMGFDRVAGIDQSPDAIRFCTEKGFESVRRGDICALPFPDCRFDLILATDIVEHVDDDLIALRELYRVLKPGGYLLITVPAFKVAWGNQDVVSHHKRRYYLAELLKKLQLSQFLAQQNFYFNYILFAPILVTRRVARALNIKPQSELNINTPAINWILEKIFWLDVRTAARIKPRFGISALAVATRSPRRTNSRKN